MSGCYFKKKDLFDCESVLEFLEKYGEKMDFKTFCENANEIYSSQKYPVITFPVPNDIVGAVLYNEHELKRYVRYMGFPTTVYLIDSVDLAYIDGVAEYLR